MPNQANANRDRTEQVALRRLGSVEDCAKVVEFLCTDLSDYVTGQCIAIDGGLMRGELTEGGIFAPKPRFQGAAPSVRFATQAPAKGSGP